MTSLVFSTLLLVFFTSASGTVAVGCRGDLVLLAYAARLSKTQGNRTLQGVHPTPFLNGAFCPLPGEVKSFIGGYQYCHKYGKIYDRGYCETNHLELVDPCSLSTDVFAALCPGDISSCGTVCRAPSVSYLAPFDPDYEDYSREDWFTTLQCPVGYSLQCLNTCYKCRAFGRDDRGNQRYKLRSEYLDTSSLCGYKNGCCTCRSSLPLPITTLPSKGPETCSGDTCNTPLSCPEGFQLSEPHGLCSSTRNCGDLGANFVASKWEEKGCEEYGVWAPIHHDQWSCRTCETKATTTTTTTTTRMLVDIFYEGSRSSSICTDSRRRVRRVERELGMFDHVTLCQASCTADWGCEYVQYDQDDGKCKSCSLPLRAWGSVSSRTVYRRKQSPAACGSRTASTTLTTSAVSTTATSASPTSAATTTATVPPEAFAPVAQPNDQACRGASQYDNAAAYYELASVESLEACKLACLAKAHQECKGIEYSTGRCELWLRPEGIGATSGKPGFTCLRSVEAPVFLPVEGGHDRACRGSTKTDNQLSYYEVSNGVASLKDCQNLCTERSGCMGIEFSTNRCEVWTRLEGIEAAIYLEGFLCMKLETLQ